MWSTTLETAKNDKRSGLHHIYLTGWSAAVLPGRLADARAVLSASAIAVTVNPGKGKQMSDQYIGRFAMASICSIAVLLPAVAYAQSSVTLYGSIDDGLVYVTKRAGSKLAEMSQGNLEPDRWGLRGTEDIG